ncbi:MAG: biotin/lipoyl-containing protein [Bacteroidia bacterium]
MYKVSVNGHPEIEIKNKDGKYLLNDNKTDFDIVANSDGTYHVLYQGKSYKIDVLKKHPDSLVLNINNQKAEAKIKNELEDLLSKMGMDKVLGNAMNELKAPMPGMVLKIMVAEGDTVKKGDSLLVLEAMKMENNIKALGDGVVSNIPIKAGDKVEKNQVLIKF